MSRIHPANLNLNKVLPYLFIIAGTIGLIASFVLTYEKIHVLTDSHYIPSCNINPIISCGSVMTTKQASLMGVPNTIFGLIAFSMLLTFGVLLAGGARVKQWVWISAQVAATIGVIFMHYLFFQGVYVINAICPWCFAVWMVTIPIFWYITLYNLQQHTFPLSTRLTKTAAGLQKHHSDILIIWYMVIIGILLQHFWYYWSSLV